MKNTTTIQVHFMGQDYPVSLRRIGYTDYKVLSAYFTDQGDGTRGVTEDGMLQIATEQGAMITSYVEDWPVITVPGEAVGSSEASETITIDDVIQYPLFVSLMGQLVANILETGALKEIERKN